MSKNIQDTVFEIIKFAKQSGLRHIHKSEIKKELLKTPLASFNDEKWRPKHPECKETKLDSMLTQALYQLTKNSKIKKKGKGKYSVDTSPERYKPKICRHLETREDGTYCLIKKVYIGDPRAQCELIHGTNYTHKIKSIEPMCPGYTNKKPTAMSIRNAKEAIKRMNQKRDDVFNKGNATKGGR